MRVLDKGFVELIDHMGSDLSVVNGARISMGKRKEVFDEKDAGLINYLAEHDHTSPFRIPHVVLHIKAPIFVMRQWMRYKIGSDFNEISGRYVEFEPEYYVPEVFRTQSKDVKQGSDGELAFNEKVLARMEYENGCIRAFMSYEALLAAGVAKEQARMVLPLALYTEVYWTASLQAVAHFLVQRLDPHAQWEIREYAKAVKELILPLYPNSLNALLEAE